MSHACHASPLITWPSLPLWPQDWSEPRTADARDADAVARQLAFTLGWFAEPVYLTGDYPAIMRSRVGERLPTFTAEESEMIRGSSDFFGLNWYVCAYSEYV